MKNKYFIDVYTLFHDKYTGIENVNYHIVKYFLDNLREEVEFFHIESIIDKKYIKLLVEKKQGGDWIKSLEKSRTIYIGEVKEYIKDVYSVGIFSHVKHIRNIFNYEVQIVHDITYLLTKEFHLSNTTRYHLEYALKDFNSNDLNVCNSQATMDDIVTYMGVDENKTMVSLLGIDIEDSNQKIYRDILSNYKSEDFILILGTIEPRKNIDIVMEYLEKSPEILETYKFIFIGRNGWGETFEDKFNQLRIDDELKKNIKHLGFISHELKTILLKSAKLLIYPSVYEGFGLPVLESIANGTPVLTTISSSIPEVGGDVSYYFNPFKIEDFEKSFLEVISDIENNKIDSQKLMDYAEVFTWASFIERFLERIKKDIRNK